MNLLDAFKQYIRDAMPGGALNPEVTTQGVLDAAALGTAPVPIVGDAIGLAADVRRLAKNPEERTPLNFTLAGLGALPFVPGGLAGMFVGKGAKTWDAISAAKAKELANKGLDARQIWKETGTFKGPDGHWRQEIPDNKMSVLRQFKTDAGGEAINLDDAIKHGDLFAAYPDAATIGAKHKKLQSGTFGGYSEGADTVVVNNGSGYFKDKELLRGGLAHEIQHAIQKREGWAKGGSPDDSALMPYVRKFYADNIDKFDGESHQLVSMAKDRAYRNLAGEAEARATQARMNMNAAQRREVFPLDSYDVPLDELIVRWGGDGPSMSVAPKAPQADALATAQKNAVTMLGLPPNNTAMDRAKALGFDADLLHGTDKELLRFDSNRAVTKDHGWYGDGAVYLTPDPDTASAYSNWKNVGAGPGGKLGQELYGQNVMPLMVRRGNVFDYGDAQPIMDRAKAVEFSEQVKGLGFNTVEVPNKYAAPEYAKNYETVVFDPSRIRSRFAAFDPARVNENDLLGRADLGMLGLLAGGSAGLAYARSDKDKKDKK